jgi:hypothetical protein
MTTWLQGATKGSTKGLTKGTGFPEFGFEWLLPNSGHPNSPKCTRITKFGSLGHPNASEKPNSVLRGTRTHPNAPKFSDNCPKPLGSLAKRWNLSWGNHNIFGENLGKNPKSQTFAKCPWYKTHIENCSQGVPNPWKPPNSWPASNTLFRDNKHIAGGP